MFNNYFFMNRFGHLVDLYAWTPHCRYLDGLGPSGTSRINKISYCSIFIFILNEEWIYETPRRLDNLLSEGKQLFKKIKNKRVKENKEGYSTKWSNFRRKKLRKWHGTHDSSKIKIPYLCSPLHALHILGPSSKNRSNIWFILNVLLKNQHIFNLTMLDYYILAFPLSQLYFLLGVL
jgi:hypothetical protein